MNAESPTPETDAELADRFARDTAPLRTALMRGARRLTGTEADAEDLLQESLMHAFMVFGDSSPAPISTPGCSASCTTGGSVATG